MGRDIQLNSWKIFIVLHALFLCAHNNKFGRSVGRMVAKFSFIIHKRLFRMARNTPKPNRELREKYAIVLCDAIKTKISFVLLFCVPYVNRRS